MSYVEVALFIVGAAALVFGYRKNQRNVLLLAAILLFLAGTVGDFTRGFASGLQQGYTNTHSSSAAK